MRKTTYERHGVEYPMQSPEVRKKSTKALIEKFGVDNIAKLPETRIKMQNTCQERYDTSFYSQTDECKQRSRETNLKNRGVEYPMQSPEVQKKSKETCMLKYNVPYSFQSDNNKEKSKITCNIHYGKDWYVQTKEAKERNKQHWIEVCGHEYPLQDPSLRLTMYANLYSQKAINKRYETMRKNDTYAKSKIESKFEKYLQNNYKDDFIRPYKSDLYPYNCDFYVKSLNLYIEIQGTWTHGFKPFEGTDEDLALVEYWKSKNTPYYNNAITNWTISDVDKRNVAKENNLNYLEIFSIDINEVIKIFEDYIDTNYKQDIKNLQSPLC